MTFIDCGDDCPGGSNHRHAYNTNPLITEITVDADGTVLFPRPVRPEDICIQDLRNVFAQVTDPGYVPDPSLPPFVWDEVNCAMVPGSWPCPTAIDWDSTIGPEPLEGLVDPSIDATTVCDCADGSTVVFREVGADCITHICVGGEILCINPLTGDPSGTVDEVCYDLSGWTFPATYGGGGGQWQVFGNDYMSEPCSETPTQFAAISKEYACWSDYGGNPGPSNGWNSLAWQQPDLVNPTDFSVVSATGSPAESHPCSRPAFRLDPGFPVGTSGPFSWTMNFAAASGGIRLAAYDRISGNQLPVNISSAPPGSTMVTETGTNGPQAFALSTVSGSYTLDFTPTAGMQLENISLLAWNMGGNNGTTETVTTLTISALPQAGSCCKQWGSLNAVAGWLTANDPNGAIWGVEANSVCTQISPGVGAVYGTFGSCEDTATPSVTEASSATGGGCPNCVLVTQDSTTGDITINQSVGEDITFNTSGSGSACPVCTTFSYNSQTGVLSLTSTPGSTAQVGTTGCHETASNGRTGEQSGVFIDDCGCLDASAWGAASNVTLTEFLTSNYPPSGFPDFWRVPVCDAQGSTELYTVLDGAWRRISFEEGTTTVVGARSCELLPTSEATIIMDPSDRSTWDPSQAAAGDFQLVAIDRFNAGDSVGTHVDTFGDPNISILADGTIPSPFTMDDGETRILYPDSVVGPFGSMPIIGAQYQFDPASLYNPPPAGSGHGEVDPTRSHRTFFDAHRIQYSYLQQQVRSGPNCDSFKFSFTFQSKSWMFEPDGTGYGLDLNVPIGESGSGAIIGNISNGQYGFLSQYSPSPITPGINVNNVTNNISLGTFNLPSPGNWVTVGLEACVDPTGGGSFAAQYSINGAAPVSFEAAVGSNFGYYFTDNTLNGQFYFTVQAKDQHEFPSATTPNWTGPTTRDHAWVGWYLTQASSRTLADVMEHGRATLLSNLCEN